MHALVHAAPFVLRKPGACTCKAKQQSTNKKQQKTTTNRQSVHIETCDSAVTRSIGIEADTVTRPDDDLAPRMARIEARRSAKDRRQRSHPNVHVVGGTAVRLLRTLLCLCNAPINIKPHYPPPGQQWGFYRGVDRCIFPQGWGI